MTNEEREAAAAIRREARVALREKISRLEQEREEALEQLAAVHEKTIDALLDRNDAERKKVAELTRERDALAAQLAALHAAGKAHRDARAACDAEAERPRESQSSAPAVRLLGATAALDAAIADTAPAVEAYTRRVQTEALESVANSLEAWGDPYTADAIAEIRRVAAEIRGGR